MHFLVTGGAGFIGSHVVDLLIKEGHSVTVLDNFSFGKEENISHHKNIKIVRAGLNDDLSEAFSPNPDVVCHLAALINVQESINDPRVMHEANISGTFNLLEACRKHNVKRFVLSSSASVYGDIQTTPADEKTAISPISLYALSKIVDEQYCKLYAVLYGLEPVMLRYFNVFGPRQNPAGNYACLIPKFITMIANKKTPIINGDGKQTRDFVFVKDVARANLLAALAPKEAVGESFNIGTGKGTSVNEVAQAIINELRNDIKPQHGPSVIEPKKVIAECTKAKKMLDWEPQVSFEQGMQETMRFFIKE